MEEMGFIYCIDNKINNNKYIGQTRKHYKVRFKQHLKNFDKKTALSKAIKKHGKKNFEIKALCYIPIKKLNSAEKHFIKRFNTFKGKGYNLTAGGYSVSTSLWDEYLSKMFKNRKYEQLTKNSEFLTHRDDSYDKFKKRLQSDEISSYNINRGILFFKENISCYQCNNKKIEYDECHDEFYCNICGIVLKERL